MFLTLEDGHCFQCREPRSHSASAAQMKLENVLASEKKIWAVEMASEMKNSQTEKAKSQRQSQSQRAKVKSQKPKAEREQFERPSIDTQRDRLKIIFMRLWFMRIDSKRAYELVAHSNSQLPVTPSPPPSSLQFQPGRVLGPKWGSDLLPLRCTPNEYWAGSQNCRAAKALQLFDFGLSVLPIFVFRSRFCICLSIRICVCVWRCRLPNSKVSFSIWHSAKRNTFTVCQTIVLTKEK